MSNEKQFTKVAVLGAGVMGAQIAAHCINVNIPVILFDLPTYSDVSGKINKSSIALSAIEKLKKQSPAPLCIPSDANLIEAANYDDDLNRLSECDLVIEAIGERLDWKLALYEKVKSHLAINAIFASNTSGISINKLCVVLSDELQSRFCGVHFFNPPRYMHLVELIPANKTHADVVDQLESFLTSSMGKGVVRALDTPNFIANRIGVFSMLAVISRAEKFNLKYDEVDALTGTKIGRAKSATFRTSDVVGLDTLAHVVATMENSLQADPFHSLFHLPLAVQKLMEMGNFGQKSKAGFYKKDGKSILVFNPSTGVYEESIGTIEPVIARILKKPINERLYLLRSSDSAQAQFLWSIYRDIFHYCAVHLGSIARSAREIDFAMRWGYGWERGPFEEWQASGWLQTANFIKEDIALGKCLCSEPLPQWVFSDPVAFGGVVHSSQGSWSVIHNAFMQPAELPVYSKQVFKASLSGEQLPDPLVFGETIFENSDMRAWTEPITPNVLIVSFKTKMNTISPDVLNGLQTSIAIAEKDYAGIVIWQPSSLKLGSPGGPFSAGANLEVAMPLFQRDGPKGVEPFVKLFQDTMMRVKYAQVPVVCAISGIALGGGCELAMHCAKRVAFTESYLGLVEVGVGLLPAGGGLKEAAIRAERAAQSFGVANYFDFIKASFENAATAKVSSSAQDAVRLQYLKEDDIIVANVHELLTHAQQQVRMLHFSGYRPPIKKSVKVAGRSVAATLLGHVTNLKDGQFISIHDAHVAGKIIAVITGGDLDPGTYVSEEWFLTLERNAFIELMGHPKTMERILGLLQTGKPIRN